MTILQEPSRAPAAVAIQQRSVVRSATQLDRASWGPTHLIRLDPDPVALAIPAEMNIEFDISWQAEQAWPYIVGDKR